MQGIEELLREIKQTGEGSWELKIEDTVYERRFFRPERLINVFACATRCEVCSCLYRDDTSCGHLYGKDGGSAVARRKLSG